MTRPRFVAFEGGEAAGKSTQAARFADRIPGAVLTREPGGTAAGAAIRNLFLDPATGDLDARTEALLMAADRAQHAADVIRPALADGRWVVTDRYLYSSVAYQAYGRGLDADWVRELSLWATAGLQPDVVVLIDVPVEVAWDRMIDRAPDRLEQESLEFHAAVRDGFLAQAAGDPDRWLVVDGDRDVEAVWADVWSGVADKMGRWPT